jgi:hypothetical protein
MKETPAAALLLERRPHEATRAVVEVLGDDAPRALYRAFDEFNTAHFAGALGAPLLFITQTSSPRALGDYCGRDVHGLRSRIRIAPKALDRGERYAVDVLLHEMVHAWASEVDEDLEPGYKGHGPRFAKKCNAIGAALGLPPVGVKGRGGLPDCAQWPICVRPAGYYPTEDAPSPKPKAKATEDEDGATTGRASGREALCSALREAITLAEELPAKQRLAFGPWLARAKALVDE